MLGGAALNSARCAAFVREAMGYEKGVDYFGAVGTDEIGEEIESITRAAGVDPNFDYIKG